LDTFNLETSTWGPGNPGNQLFVFSAMITTGATPGDLEIVWAQESAAVFDTTMKAASHIDYCRLL
jgi:hypothetical protein